MRAVVTRVSSASVAIDGETVGEIGTGFLVLLGIGPEDTQAQAEKLADKICGLRVFADQAGKMNLNLAAVGGALLVVSQFTLYADIKSRRPGFTKAAPPAVAIPLYETFLDLCRARGFQVEHGQFGADMAVASVNDGPVTIWMDTEAMQRGGPGWGRGPGLPSAGGSFWTVAGWHLQRGFPPGPGRGSRLSLEKARTQRVAGGCPPPPLF